MKHYHIVIKQERRTDPARMAQPLNSLVGDPPAMDEQDTRPVVTQLHMCGTATEIKDMENIALAYSWEPGKPYVEVIVGDFSTRNMSFAGWPKITKAEWDEQQQEGNP